MRLSTQVYPEQSNINTLLKYSNTQITEYPISITFNENKEVQTFIMFMKQIPFLDCISVSNFVTLSWAKTYLQLIKWVLAVQVFYSRVDLLFE